MGTELLPLAQQLLFKQESAGPIFSRVLSTTEHIRLARAFYHLELYGHLFHKLDIPQEEHVRFLQALRDFELDEFLCVASYLLSRLRNYEDKMEGAGLEVVGSERANDHWCFGENVNCIWIDPWEDRALASGLGALKKLLTADSVKSRQAAVGRIDDLQWTTLSSCLIEMAQGHQSNIYSPISMIDSYREAESRNLSWALQLDGRKRKEAGFWAKHDRCFALGFSRRRGCAIWDEDRLEAIRDRTPNG
ncbi:hypothetical protein FQN49_007638 [Arthroderma sp. PD_2]|nr:hypothetical protein FQN49_007638 [Arthroderma sp. PD_2]